MRLVTYVDEGCYIPWWSGICWYDYVSGKKVVTLLPFNILFRLGRDLILLLKKPFKDGSDYYKKVYDMGYIDGREDATREYVRNNR